MAAAAAVAPRKPKKQEAEAHVNHERWLLTYADMITLLMVFFLVMWSLGRTDAAKFKQLSTSLKRAFHVEVLMGDDPTALKGNNGNTVATTVLQEAITMSTGAPPNPQMLDTIEQIRGELLQFPAPEPGGTVDVGLARDGVVISLAGNVLFESGKADLKPRGLLLLDAVIAQLEGVPNEIRIEGHTDNVPIATPLYPSNWELSSARATTVGRFLAEQGEIAPKRIIAAGYGEHRPVASNETREGRARNRRVDIVILFPQSPSAAAGGSATQPGGAANPGGTHDRQGGHR